MTYMLDTNICIYIMKNKSDKILNIFKDKLEHGICISTITLAELEYGMAHSSYPRKNEEALIRFLAPVDILEFDADAASTYGQVRNNLQSQGSPIGPLDMLIASHAQSEDLILVTDNVKEFIKVPELKIENWAE